MGKKLTDEEIVKALKCCMRIDGCDKCPLVEIPTLEQCRNNKNKCALDLIKHLQGENKRLKQSNKNTLFVNEQVMSENAKQKAEIERLTGENKHLTKLNEEKRLEEFSFSKKIVAENAELQKQVDELTERYLEESKERCEFEQKYKKIQHAHNIGLGTQRVHWEKKVQQAVKDTAKEIYSAVLEFCPVHNDGSYSKFISLFEEWLKHKYGVEVE